MTKFGKRLTIILSILLCLSIVIGSYNYSRLSHKLSVAEHNITSLTDTIHSVELKNGELMQWNQALVVDNSMLKDELASENLSKKEIERTLNSKIQNLTKIIAEFRPDTIHLTDTVQVHPNGDITTEFQYSDDFLRLSGKTLIELEYLTSKTTINNLSVRVPLTVGLTKDNQVFVTSQNPSASIELLESFSLDQKMYNQHRLGLGVYTGFGFSYGLIERKIDLGPQVGVGLYYRIW